MRKKLTELSYDQIGEAEIDETVQNDPWASGSLNRIHGGISHWKRETGSGAPFPVLGVGL